MHFLDIPKKYSYIRFHENPSSGNSCSIPTDGQTDIMKLIFAFHNFVNAPKNHDEALGI
jgi:hypothetical protein